MAFLDFLLGKRSKTEQFQRYTPEQQQTLSQLLGGASRQLPSGFDFLSDILGQSPEAMARFEAPAKRQFYEEIVPTLSERFTGMFGEGSQKSSAFGQQLGKAGAGLAENLAARRAALGFDALASLQSLLGAGLSSQFDTAYRPGTQGLLGGVLGGASQGAGQGIGELLARLLSRGGY